MSPDKKLKAYSPDLTELVDTILLKIAELQDALYEKGVKMEHIKTDKPLIFNGHEITNLNGVDFKTIIYEDDATHWKRSADSLVSKSNPNGYVTELEATLDVTDLELKDD